MLTVDKSSRNVDFKKGKVRENTTMCYYFPSYCQQVEENSLDLEHGQQTPLHHVCQVIFESQQTCQA